MGQVHHFGSSWTAMGSCVCDTSLAGGGAVLSWTMKVKRLTPIDLIGLGEFNSTLTTINFVVFAGRGQMQKLQDPELPDSSPRKSGFVCDFKLQHKLLIHAFQGCRSRSA